jgi:hypothetical protein
VPRASHVRSARRTRSLLPATVALAVGAAAATGVVIVSFGGYTVDSDGTDLGAQCSSAAAMAAQVESVVTTFNVSHLDFDIESNEQYNNADLALTAQALSQVRSWAGGSGRQLTIGYTVPVLPTGLTSDGQNILTTAKANGFTPDIVNIMTMDYGSAGTEMGTAANQALDATAGQLASMYGISSGAASAMLGNTPMIGQNDTPGEILALADASAVESHAAQKGIAWLSFWAEGRDNDGCPNTGYASSTCSGISQSNGAFTQAFQPFTADGGNGGGGGGGGSPTPTPTPTPTTSSPSGSCAAA